MRFLVILGLLVTGYCSPDSRCHRIHGKCQDMSEHCSGAYRSGKCGGPITRKCCAHDRGLALEFVRGTISYGARDLLCQHIHGICQDVSRSCGGTYLSKKCGGPRTRQCCVRHLDHARNSVRGQCTLVTYSSSHMKGLYGRTVRVHEDFKPFMERMNQFAGTCHVTVLVTSSFRKSGQTLHGTVVPPATKSNHLVGHAIDFNLSTPAGWCNSKCLQAQTNSYAQCFLGKVTDNGLRWGGNFRHRDPVHIDDGLNLHDKNRWTQLYIGLQRHC